MIQAYRESRCWLLGDSIYPLEPWLQTPIPEAEVGTPEYHFTREHCKNRNPVERCNGVLKGRWRCCLWDRTLHYLPEKAASIINACAVLHNFCVLNNLDVGAQEEAPNNPDDGDVDDPGLMDDVAEEHDDEDDESGGDDDEIGGDDDGDGDYDGDGGDVEFDNVSVRRNRRQWRLRALAERQYLVDYVQERRRRRHEGARRRAN